MIKFQSGKIQQCALSGILSFMFLWSDSQRVETKTAQNYLQHYFLGKWDENLIKDELKYDKNVARNSDK